MIVTRPFQPFRIFVSGGEVFDIRHPELCMPGVSSVIVGLPSRNSVEPAFDGFTVVNMDHIIRLEPIAPTVVNKT